MSPLQSAADSLQLRSVRLRGAADALHARQRFELAISAVEASTLGLPPSALLVVRRLAPSARLRLDPGGRVDAFGRAVRGDLALSAQRARRPWLHADASAAASVLFVDEAELVACLVRDWLCSALAERWWWPAVLRGLPALEWLRRHALARGDVLPAVLARLAPRGDAVAWLANLDDAEVERAYSAVIEANALASTLCVGESPATSQAAHQAAVDPEPAQRKPGAATVRAADPALLQRLLTLVPELHATRLAAPQRRLLALAVCLQRASAWARTAEFARALQSIDSAGVAAAAQQPTPAARLPVARASSDAVESARTGATPTHNATSWSPPAEAPHRESPLAPVLAMPERPPAADRFEPPDVVPPPAQPRRAVHTNAADSLATSTDPALPPATRSIDTAFGGIFYLLNVALALGLYGDFTQPLRPGIALSPWDWLALLGRTWFGREFDRDPVSALLAGLAGRAPGEEPGRDFVSPQDSVVPADWLTPWPTSERLRMRITRQRVQLWHEAGFVLIDVPRAAASDPLEQARALSAQFGWSSSIALLHRHQPPHPPTRPASSNAALARWIDCLAHYLRARLMRALAVDEREAPVAIVCRHPARLHCTDTALEVHLSLAGLPLPLRIAGLDRDPGWIPAAGRSLSFHFA